MSPNDESSSAEPLSGESPGSRFSGSRCRGGGLPGGDSITNAAVPGSMPCYVSLDDSVLLGQCEVDTYRASGPGGQKRNKTASAIRLRHQPTGMSAKAVESRSQHENKARALKRLRLTIALIVRRSVELESYEPSEIVRSCIGRSGKFSIGKRDQRYYEVVWEILDLLFACRMQVSTAAKMLGISTGNFSTVLRNDPALWRRVNELRKDEGLSSLK